MCDLFNTIALPVRKIVHRVNAPFVAATVMVCVFDTIDDRVTHEHIGMRHVYFSTQYFFAIFLFTGFHVDKEFEIFGDAPASVLIVFTGFGGRAFQRRDLFGGRIINIGQAFIDQVNRVII